MNIILFITIIAIIGWLLSAAAIYARIRLYQENRELIRIMEALGHNPVLNIFGGPILLLIVTTTWLLVWFNQ